MSDKVLGSERVESDQLGDDKGDEQAVAKASLKRRLAGLSSAQRQQLLALIAERRAAKSSGNSVGAVVEFEALVAPTTYALSRAQRRLWIAAQLGDSASAAYNIAAAFHFSEGLDEVRLAAAWRVLLERHSVLRSAFVPATKSPDGSYAMANDGEEIAQLMRPSDSWSLREKKLPKTENPDLAIARFAREEAATALDLEKEWLIKITLLRFEGRRETGLVIVIHHTVCDGLSIPILTRELERLYLDPAHAFEPARQYWQEIDSEGARDASASLAYWEKQFSSLPEPLPIPTDYPRPAKRSFEGASVAIEIDPELVKSFEARCADNRASFYMGCVALTQLILARFSGHSDIAIGTPIAGRLGAATANTIGPFVNTIVLRTEVEEEKTFSALLTRAREVVLGGFAHQDLSFDSLVQSLGITPDPSHSPLFDVMLGLNAAEEGSLVLGGSEGRQVRLETSLSKVDLTFHLERQGDGGLHLELEYATSLFSRGRMISLATAWKQLLMSSVEQGFDTKAERLALVNFPDRAALLANELKEWRWEGCETIAERFAEIATKFPHEIAVRADSCSLTYAQLDAQSNTVARWLDSQYQIQHEEPVGIMLEKSERMIVALLGILKSGGAYLPLTLDTPSDRADFVLNDAAVRVLLTEGVGLEPTKATSERIARIDFPALLVEMSNELAVEPDAPVPLCSPSSLAYIIYTSGSTGLPKGTLIEQRSVLRLVLDTDFHQVVPGENVLQTGSLAFDASTFEIWGALLNGGCCCIPPGHSLLEVNEFDSLIEGYAVDTAFMTTGLFNQLVEYNVGAFKKLTTVLTGGEKISVSHVNRLISAFPNLALLHVYGPTENTTFSSWHRIEGAQKSGTVPIGKTIAGSSLMVLDKNLEPVPAGFPGEIVCGGLGLARGYLARPEMDEKAFANISFAAGVPQRLYRTGDIGLWNADGDLVFLGRNDHQVKIRGFRVELGEVDAFLRELDGVRDAVAVARPNGVTNDLIAYVVLDKEAGSLHALPQSESKEEALRKALRLLVPKYMVPSRFVFLDEFPLNASGKVDKKVLVNSGLTEETISNYDAQNSASADENVTGTDAKQQLMIALYSSILGLTRVTIEDNFFALGGDSIKAIQLVAQARQRGYRFALADLFAAETLALLCERIQIDTTQESEPLLLEAPLSPIQRWWLDQEGTPRDHFSLSTVLRVAGALDNDLLEACTASLVAVHSSLRMSLDIPTQRQRIASEGGYSFASMAIDSRNAQCLTPEQGAQLDNFWDSLQSSVTLIPPRLISLGVVSLADETLLGLVVHHLAADEVTGRLLAANLEKLYLAQNSDESIRTIAEGLSYTNWSEKLSVLAKQGRFDCDTASWTKEVDEAKALPSILPSETPKRVALDTQLDQAKSTQLLALASTKTRAKPLELLASAFALAWQSITGADRCLVSMESHGREEIDTLRGQESTVGWFTAMYPFVLDARGSSVEALLANKDHIRALPNKGLSYGALRFLTTPEQESALSVTPSLSFNFLGADTSGAADSLFTVLPISVGENNPPTAPAPFAIDVLCSLKIDNSGGRSISLHLQGLEKFCYSAGVDECSLEALMHSWVRSIDVLAQELDAAPTQLSVSDCCATTVFQSNAELDSLLRGAKLPVDSIEDILPVTSLQSGLFLHSDGTLNAGATRSGGAYSDQVCLRLPRLLDSRKLARVYSALLDENEALRARFLLSDSGQVVQVILRSGGDHSAGFEFFDYTNRVECIESEQGSASSIKSLRLARRERGFDLSSEAPFRLALIHLADGQSELLFDFHHIAIDGWSSSLLLDRIQSLYESASLHSVDYSIQAAVEPAGRLTKAPQLSSYYRWLEAQSFESAREYWGELLGDYRHALQVPSAAPRLLEKGEPNALPIFTETRIDATTVAALTSWCAATGATLSAALQTIWGRVLAHETGTRDVVFGATVAGRDAPVEGIDRLVGMFINTLPVRVSFGDEHSFADTVGEVAQQFSRSIDFGFIPLAEIQALSPAGAGLLSHTVVFENYPASGDDTEGDEWRWETVDIFDPMHFEFGLIIAPVDGEIRLRFVADGALYDTAALQRLGRAIANTASEMAASSASGRAWRSEGVDDKPSARAWSISANFTADLLESKLAFWESLAGSARAIHLLAYDQIVQELMNPNSALHQIESTEHLILWRAREDEEPARALSNAEFLMSALQGYAARVNDPCVRIVLCPLAHNGQHDELGGTKIDRTLASFFERACAQIAGVHYHSLANLAADFGLKKWCLAGDAIVGDVPYSEAFFAALATSVFRQRDLRDRQPIKVIAVDADETLWGGIVGEDGPEGIDVTGVYAQLQTRLSELRASGTLLCLVTKNNHDDVIAAFEHNDMPLKLTDFTRVCASWAPKSVSIRELAEDLSLGLDSFLFIDDSPVECDEVRISCPTVRTVQVPRADDRAEFLANLWLLDAGERTAEDLIRAQSYSDELQRREAAKSATDFGDFLAQLEVTVEMAHATAEDFPRIAQLTQRTNQFNTTTLRLTEAQVVAFAAGESTEIRRVVVSDRFGDYGLTGALVIDRGAKEWQISGFLLSCRVLGRGVEHEIVKRLADEMAAVGAETLVIKFAASARNQPARLFLDSLATAGKSQGSQELEYRLSVCESNYWSPTGHESDVQASAPPAESAAVQHSGDTGSAKVEATDHLRARWTFYQEVAQLSTAASIDAAMKANAVTIRRNRKQEGAAQIPSSNAEIMVAKLWQELLGIKEIDIRDEFYALGGHSLKAVMLLSRLRVQHGIALGLQDIQDKPTLGAFARLVETVLESGESLSWPEMVKAPLADDYPTAPGQARLWMLEKMRGEGPSPFHMQAALVFDGECDRQALDYALTELLRTHESLRTGIQENGHGEPRQQVFASDDIALSCEWLDATLAESALLERGKAFSQIPFDLTAPPLCRLLAAPLISVDNSARFGLVLVMHHSVSDGWSIGILAKELSALYADFANAKTREDENTDRSSKVCADDVASIQYKDYAYWLERSLASEAGQQSSAYWLAKFANPVDALTLPLDRPRPLYKSSVGATLELSVSAAAWSGFSSLTSERGLTQFATLLAALEFVLARFSGQTNFCVGSPVAGRTHPELESLIGFFVNVLPLRATIDLNWTVDELLAAVSSEVAESLSHQTLPFDSIIDQLDLPRDMSRSPLFDILLVLQNASDETLTLGSAEGRVLRVESETSQYDIAFNAYPLPDHSLKLIVDYDTALFSPVRIERLVASLEVAMLAMTEKSTATLAQIDWVPANDRLKLRAFEGAFNEGAFNEGDFIEGAAQSLPEMVTAAAKQAKGLLSDTEASWTYKELIAEMSLVFAALEGLEQGAVVGVLGARSLRSVSAMLGIMRAGCIYLPLDSANPPSRLQGIAEDAGAQALLITNEFSARVAQNVASSARVIEYFSKGIIEENASFTIAAGNTNNERSAFPSATDIAYTIYTSGSTGKPKGVRVSHGSFAAMIRAQVPAFSITSSDVCGQFATLAFDASLSEIFLALTQGASLAIAPDSARQDVGVFLEWVDAFGVTAITLPPAFLRAFDKKRIPGLRVLVTAGEAADASDLRYYAEHMTVINAYGPTETSVCATTYRVAELDEWAFGVPIGKPLTGTLCSIRDGAGALVALGVEGELYIGGPTVASGYHARSELNAERFGDLLPEHPRERWYRSGDRCRWRDDGLLEFVGRDDTQLKVRGFRIEPGEVEHALRGLKDVTDAAVALDPVHGLIGYAAISEHSMLATTEPQNMLDRLATLLPSYMIPAQLILLPELPRTIAGKIDRPQLPLPTNAMQAAYAAPIGENEAMLARVWQRVLNKNEGSKTIGRNDDFFGLGGDSIKALRVISELRAQARQLSIKQLFAAPRLCDAAALLVPVSPNPASANESAALVGPVPLLPPQQWYLQRQASESAGHFNIVIELALNSAIKTSKLEAAFLELIKAHASLRAQFVLVDGRWQQSIRPQEECVFEIVDIDAEVVGERAQAIAEAAITRPFVLGSDMLLRCVRVIDSEHSALFVAVHHLVADWVSVRILVNDLNAAYAGEKLAADGKLLLEQAEDRQRHFNPLERVHTEVSVKNAFALLERHSLVPGHHASLVTDHFSLSKTQTAQLVARLGGIKLHEYLLHHSTLALSQLLAIQTLPVLIEGHGRSEIKSTRALEKLVGWLTQAKLVWLTPVLSESEGLTNARECLATLRASESDVFPVVAPEQVTLPAVLSFNYLGEFDEADHTASASQAMRLTPRVFEGAMAAQTHADVPLHLEFYLVDGAFELQIAWSPRAFGDKRVDALWSALKARLEGMVGNHL